MSVFPIITAIALAATPTSGPKCYMVTEGGDTVDLGHLCQVDSSTPSVVPTSRPVDVTPVQTPTYSQAQSSGDLHVSSVSNQGAMVYGTLQNDSDRTVRNITVWACVTTAPSCSAGYGGEEYFYGGIINPGSKIEIPVFVRSASGQSGLIGSGMTIVDYSID